MHFGVAVLAKKTGGPVVSAVVVATWRPLDAICLQRALRLTNESFAETLGSAPRTVAKWHANPDMSLTTEMQAALDTLLRRATDEARDRFAQLRQVDSPFVAAADVAKWEKALCRASHLHTALDFLDEWRGDDPGASLTSVATRAAEMTAGTDGLSRPVSRRQMAALVLNFYSSESGLSEAIRLRTSDAEVTTTLVTRRGWLANTQAWTPTFALSAGSRPPRPRATSQLVQAAESRLALCVRGTTRLSDQPTYRLLHAGDEPNGMRARFGMTGFARYALTWDLLEAEVQSAAAGGTSGLPIREQLLPTVQSVFEPSARECVGGALALSAFARPAAAGRPSDYVLLIQLRSSKVLNGAGRMAVIPKCFHQPTNEATADVSVKTTLLRELEEELFGRTETDNSRGASSVADLLHPSRLTAPMRWLMASGALDVHLTGFAYNLMAGSFEFPALLAVHDEAFWQEHGGCIEGNWESCGLLRYSSADPDGLEALLHDPQWSDEGLVAFALGLKRLAQLNPGRVSLPDFRIGAS